MIRKNPLTVRGHIRRCWLFSWRTPEASVRDLVPTPMRLVTRSGFAFWNVVVCEMHAMRPPPLPAWTGIRYWHVAYRLHVSVRETDGGELEGLYFVRSDCDNAFVATAGNILTDFHFHPARIAVADSGPTVDGRIDVAGASARFRIERETPPTLSVGSPFRDLSEAASFLKYKPRAFSSHAPDAVNVVQVRRKEDAWRSRVVAAPDQEWEFFAGRDVAPEICTEVEPIHYQWDRGRILGVVP